MLAVAGVVTEIDAPDTAESSEGLERIVSDCEDMIAEYLQTVLTPTDNIRPIKVWISAEPVSEIRAADFIAKHERAKYQPEYGLLPSGRIALDEALQAQAEQTAEAESEASEIG